MRSAAPACVRAMADDYDAGDGGMLDEAGGTEPQRADTAGLARFTLKMDSVKNLFYAASSIYNGRKDAQALFTANCKGAREGRAGLGDAQPRNGAHTPLAPWAPASCCRADRGGRAIAPSSRTGAGRTAPTRHPSPLVRLPF